MSIYQIDTAHSSAQFKVRHMMIANVKGEFDKVNGTVNFDPANPSASTVEASIAPSAHVTNSAIPISKAPIFWTSKSTRRLLSSRKK